MTKLLSFPIGLLSLLLSYGVVEAQQDLYSDCFHPSNDNTTYDICRMPDMRKILSEPKSCELKMKEAMKMADGTLFNRPAYVPPRSFEEREQRYRDDKAAWEKWNAVMKECVK